MVDVGLQGVPVPVVVPGETGAAAVPACAGCPGFAAARLESVVVVLREAGRVDWAGACHWLSAVGHAATGEWRFELHACLGVALIRVAAYAGPAALHYFAVLVAPGVHAPAEERTAAVARCFAVGHGASGVAGAAD